MERSSTGFTHERRVYGPGTWVVSLAQPKRGVVRWLLGRTLYPDNTYTRTAGGDPIRPYDMSGDVLAEFMGVRVDEARTPVEAELEVVGERKLPAGTVASTAPGGYRVDGALNDAFKAANLLFDAGASLRRVTEDTGMAKRGDFIVARGTAAETLGEVAEATGVSFTALDTDASGASHPLSQQRIGMYQRYYGGNMDEGWTRWLLEDFGFEYTSLFDEEILAGELQERWDVIVLPADSKEGMLGREDPGQTPPDYQSGFGEEGVKALNAFVENGGTLVTFAQAGQLVLDEFDVPGARRRGRQVGERVLGAGLDAQGQGGHLESVCVRDAGGCARRLPRRRAGLRDGPRRAQRRRAAGADLRGPGHPAKRLAARRGRHRRQGRHGVGGPRGGHDRDDRLPRAAPRPDPRHLQAVLQRAGGGVGRLTGKRGPPAGGKAGGRFFGRSLVLAEGPLS